MSVTIQDLIPKKFKIKLSVEGEKIELECSPLRLSHALIISKVGEAINQSNNTSKEDLLNAEKMMDEVIAELIPELKDIKLSMNTTIELIPQMLESIQPSDDKELKESGVKVDNNPKAQRTG